MQTLNTNQRDGRRSPIDPLPSHHPFRMNLQHGLIILLVKRTKLNNILPARHDVGFGTARRGKALVDVGQGAADLVEEWGRARGSGVGVAPGLAGEADELAGGE